ncbi:restriction endonuclease subunit S [Rothia mucilaginosa]|uniref:restriction endonuclease subunit S n=1 Tax=Rothia mucilaginosa TaxID=43675 RepID=UPI0028DC2FB8|nr:restriction endonuclease subunit S [Rothia mucilaginosa]
MKRLTEKEWKPIKIIDIFETIKPGKISQANQFEKVSNGGVNYIAATNRNNGVLYYLEPSEDLKKKVQSGNCIGFIKDGDGSAGYAIYKHEPFASTVNVIYGYADWLNRENGLFFVAAQDMIEDKYSHGYKRNLQHLRGDKVMLPVDDKGNPDFAYMTLYSAEVRGGVCSCGIRTSSLSSSPSWSTRTFRLLMRRNGGIFSSPMFFRIYNGESV